MPPRLRSDARRNRDRLLEAANEVIAESGPDASLEEIARRAGVGSATLHRHFGGRAELLEAVLRERVEALCARAGVLAGELSSGEALVGWLREVVAHAAISRGLGAALTGGGYEPVFSPHTAVRAAALGLLAQAQLEGAVARGVSVDDVLQLANGVALAAESQDDPAGRAEALMVVVANGLLVR
ncbi:TetR/AcrR family transcriptional regulator [Actinosynnema pretiosum subsp. pretiosum]|uniref:Transcriptional regulator, TetR family n=2 Tax=Actinosynnema TaxID=40566 RepID=C6WNY0_ACTMD|nr:TetR/AcrR family transcriptional regulator [Actinosynnema mirum]ACU36649.1 transcriptional regulator, TetR family [Actinosynnema mirum DSM 43827]AXX30104.1 TetR-family transcriptional regulator [Actinosynnema pretiosum subsp. pretiosum]QUF05727.1 TetR/AcrR family transcriptional regulator [Actinosynnema pretiosum subsp. pretiosum]